MSSYRGTVFLLCGLAFSGKTTLAEAIAEVCGAPVISLDRLNEERGLYGGDGVPAEEWARSHETALALLGEKLREGHPRVVIDDTCCFRFLRDDYRGVAGRHGYATRVIRIETPLAEIERRRRANDAFRRREAIRDEVFDAHRESFEWPRDDEDVLVFPWNADVPKWISEHVSLGRRTGKDPKLVRP